MLWNLARKGLQAKLEESHPLLMLYKDVLLTTHPSQPDAVKNCTSMISRTFRYAQDKIL